MRHSVLWEKLAEQVFRQLDIFRSQFYEPKSCYLFIYRKALKSSMMMTAPCDQQKTCAKNMNLIICTPCSPKSHICFLLTSLEQFLRAIRGAVSQIMVLILPQIKFDSQFLHCVFRLTKNYTFFPLVRVNCSSLLSIIKFSFSFMIFTDLCF